MPLLKKARKGGCSGYADVSNNFMLMDNALKPTTGGGARKARKDDRKYRKKGGEGDATASTAPPAPQASASTPPPAPSAPPAPPAVASLSTSSMMPSGSSLGLGSAFSGMASALGAKGGCGAMCNRRNKKDQKKGGTGVELAPFISSLVLLGLRIGNDKMLQEGATKQLSDMVKSKSSPSSKKTTSKKTSSAKASSKRYD